jgi:hypothetical protein
MVNLGKGFERYSLDEIDLIVIFRLVLENFRFRITRHLWLYATYSHAAMSLLISSGVHLMQAPQKLLFDA